MSDIMPLRGRTPLYLVMYMRHHGFVEDVNHTICGPEWLVEVLAGGIYKFGHADAVLALAAQYEEHRSELMAAVKLKCLDEYMREMKAIAKDKDAIKRFLRYKGYYCHE